MGDVNKKYSPKTVVCTCGNKIKIPWLEYRNCRQCGKTVHHPEYPYLQLGGVYVDLKKGGSVDKTIQGKKARDNDSGHVHGDSPFTL